MKKIFILLSILFIITLFLPHTAAHAKDNGVDDLRGRWDVNWGYENTGLILYINDWVPSEVEEGKYYSGGCMRTLETDTFLPLSLQAKYLDDNSYEVDIYSTAVLSYGEPFIVKFDGNVKVYGNGVTDDVADGTYQTANEIGGWSAEHHDRRRTKCPTISGDGFGVQADVYAHMDLAYNTPRYYTLLEMYTVVVSSGMRVEAPDGSTMVVQEYTDIFSPDVDFVGRFRYLTHFDGAPISGEPYHFVLLDIFGNPIPGTESTDTWIGCPQEAPTNLETTIVSNDDVILSWTAIDLVPEQFDPNPDDPESGIGFYQIGVSPFNWEGDKSYGGSGIQSPEHIIPWKRDPFDPGQPGEPDGADFGTLLSDLPEDGLYQVQSEAFSLAKPIDGGYGLECSVFNSAEQLVMSKVGGQLDFIPMTTISGSVTDDAGIPLVGIDVGACDYYDLGFGFCSGDRSDSNGYYTIILPAGVYRVGAFPESGYEQEFYEETPDWNEASPVDVSLGQQVMDINFTLSPPTFTLLMPYNGMLDYDEFVDNANMLAGMLSDFSGLEVQVLVPEGSRIEGLNTAIEGMQSGWVDMALMPWQAFLLAYETAGAQPGLNLLRFGAPYYESQFLTYAGSGVGYIEDLEGRPLCWVDQFSDSGYIVPSMMMLAAGIDPYSDAYFAGAHDQLVWELYNQNCDGGASFVDVRTLSGFPDDVFEKVLSIATSPPIPNEAFVFTGALPEETRNQLIDAFLQVAGIPEGENPLYNLFDYFEGMESNDFGLYQGLYDLMIAAGVNPQELWDYISNPPPEPTSTLTAAPAEDYVDGRDWPEEAEVQLTIYDFDGVTEIYSDSGVAIYPEGDEWSTWVYFDLGEFDLQPGHLVVLTDQETTKEHVVTDLMVTGVNPDLNIISGSAGPDSEVHVMTQDVEVWTTADGAGLWDADFTSIHDLAPGTCGAAAQYDEDGDQTKAEWCIPNPTLHVVPAHPEVHGHEWNPEAVVTIYVDDDDDLGNGWIYEETKPVVQDNWCGDPCFDVSNVPELSAGILPEHVVTMTDGITTKVVHTTSLVWTGADITANTVFGTADADSWVEVSVHGPEWAQRLVQADASGYWEADFSVPGTEDFEQDILYLGQGYHGRAIQFEDGVPDDGTLAYWHTPQYTIVAHPDHGWVASDGWVIGDLITLTIDDPEFLGTLTEFAEPTDWDPTIGEVWFNSEDWGEFNLTSGVYVNVTDGTTTDILFVETLSIDFFDQDNGIVCGTAPSNRNIGIGMSQAYPPLEDLYFWVDTNTGDGNWCADFSGQGVDFPQVYDIHAMIWDEDGDATQANYDFP